MRTKRFTEPMKVFVSWFFTPYPGKTTKRERTKEEVVQGDIKTPKELTASLVKLLADAKASGLVVTVSQQSVYPPAVGRYCDHIEIRESREVVNTIMARPDPQ